MQRYSKALLIIPWARHCGLKCCRRAAIPLYAITAASRALTPSQGKAEAWLALPWNLTFTLSGDVNKKLL